jgi:hypothetical protein
MGVFPSYCMFLFFTVPLNLSTSPASTLHLPGESPHRSSKL